MAARRLRPSGRLASGTWAEVGHHKVTIAFMYRALITSVFRVIMGLRPSVKCGLASTLGAALAGAALAAHALPKSHCKPSEDVLFNCTMRSKTLSFCSSKEVAGTPRSWIQYRFGTVGSPELVFPTELRPPGGSFQYSVTSGGRWRDVHVQFASKGFKYVLHAYGNGAIPESEASLTVVDPTKVRTELRCADPGLYAAAGLWSFEEFQLPPVDEEFTK